MLAIIVRKGKDGLNTASIFCVPTVCTTVGRGNTMITRTWPRVLQEGLDFFWAALGARASAKVGQMDRD